jgi:hypothetical protein
MAKKVFIPGPLTSLKKVVPDSVINVSAKEVPHLVVRRGSTTFSICWFGKGGFFRVFWPYPNDNQSHWDCATVQGTVDFLAAQQ